MGPSGAIQSRRRACGAGRAVVHAWPAGWDVEAARTHVARGRGLLGRDALVDGAGLWLPVRSVHTFGMRFAIDLVWLDGTGTVLRVDGSVGPRRVRTCLRAAGGVVEVAAGRGATFAVDLGPSGCPDAGRAR